ncbi:MAG: ROK family protein [Granulosicoccus sp.]|nr:ROK family protein [Granulosicoccus sp.]
MPLATYPPKIIRIPTGSAASAAESTLQNPINDTVNRTALSPGSVLRRQNRQQILTLLAKHRKLSRTELCLRTGLTGAAVSRITRELLQAELLEETKEKVVKGSLGRRKSSLSLNPAGACVLGVTIAANKLMVALIDAEQAVVCEQSVENPPVDKSGLADTNGRLPSPNHSSLVETLISAAESLLQQNGIDRQRLVGIGISVAVPSADSITSEGRVTSRILGWEDVPVAEPFIQAFNLPVAIDARAMSLLRAELYSGVEQGGGRDANSVFLINVGLGIGTASIVANSVLSSGNSGFGGLSHMAHPASDINCYCGRSGCLELCASGAAVVCELMSDAWQVETPFDSLRSGLDDALQRADAGDKIARDAFFVAGLRMSAGVDSINCLINPDLVVLAGETGRQPDYIEGLRAGLKQSRSRMSAEQLKLSTVRSVQGAACTALDAFVFSQELNLPNLRSDAQVSDVS